MGLSDRIASLKALVTGRGHKYTAVPTSGASDIENGDSNPTTSEVTRGRRIHWPNRDRAVLKCTMGAISLALVVYVVVAAFV